MKMRRYLASDMRQALKAVREAQGPDAVILSSRRVDGGVEVVAAIDYDEPGAEAVAPAAPRLPAGKLFRSAAVPPSAPASAAPPAPPASSGTAWPARTAQDASAELTAALRLVQSTQAAADSGTSQRVGELGQELQRLRQMLETQIATLAWNDLTRRAPNQSEVLKHLTEIGLAAQLAAEIVSELPPGLALEQATHRAEALIAQRLHTAPDRWLEKGGVVALVGPTGAGKTSAIAKLAAHWALRHGSQSLALVSADNARLGAPDQAHILGRLLGAPSYSIAHPRELGPVLEGLRDRRLVLIDTAGGTARDPHLGARLAALVAASPRIETSLVLAASSQAGVLAEAYERFAAAKPASCIVTKLDEAVSLGGTLSLLIRTGLPVSYVSDGQRVPEDLAPARAHQLVVRALSARARSAAWADEELLQRRFGGVAHALA
jgi:flagellar biosynthesis protein FlhF